MAEESCRRREKDRARLRPLRNGWLRNFKKPDE